MSYQLIDEFAEISNDVLRRLPQKPVHAEARHNLLSSVDRLSAFEGEPTSNPFAGVALRTARPAKKQTPSGRTSHQFGSKLTSVKFQLPAGEWYETESITRSVPR
jgi:hypothetical protein